MSLYEQESCFGGKPISPGIGSPMPEKQSSRPRGFEVGLWANP